MAARKADGFDHYGEQSTAALLENGNYLEASMCQVSSERPRTGPYALVIRAGNNCGPRWGLGDDLEDVGVGYAFWLPRLPTDSSSVVLLSLRDADNRIQLRVNLTSAGQVRVLDSEDEEVGRSGQVIQARAYQHFEAHAVSGSPGSIEIRINMVTVLTVPSFAAGGPYAQAHVGSIGFANTGLLADWYLDDLYSWDSTGDAPNDWVGDKKAFTTYPAQDTLTAEWTPSVGSTGFEMLNNVPPLDDSEYITAPTVGLKSRFGLSDLPPEVVSIAFVAVTTRMAKTDAGAGNVAVGLVSNLAEEQAPAHPLTLAPTYYQDFFPYDPDTGTIWDTTGFNAAELTLERTA